MFEQVKDVILLVSVMRVFMKALKSRVCVALNVVVVSDVNTTSAVSTLFDVPASKLSAVAPSIATAPDEVMVANVMPVPADTLVTVPVPATEVHEVTPAPSVVSTWLKVPLVEGSWNRVAVPATAAGLTVTSPEVEPNILTLPSADVFVPRVKAPEDKLACATVAGVVPAPPPTTIAPAPSTPDDANAVALLKYRMPPLVALPG